MYFFDARFTMLGEPDGLTRFGASLVTALAKLTPVTMLIYDRRQLKSLPKDVPHIVVNNPASALQELLLPRKLNRLGAEVVYSPLFVMGTWGRKYKLILTLHDLTNYKFRSVPPTYLPAFQRAAIWLFHRAYWPGRFMLNQADVVVTVSETSKREILEHHLTDRQVHVIYNAPPHLPTVKGGGKVKRELVFMGTLMPFKNAELLMRALPLLPEYHVHLTGRGTPDRLRALKELAGEHVGRVTFWNGASDSDYAKVLGTATALVSASKAEGFGLPLVEAMAARVPVICSDMDVFHEVSRDAALYFDPDSPDEFAARVRELESPEVRARLIKRGLARAKDFSWDASAKQLYAIMRELAPEAPAARTKAATPDLPPPAV